MAGQHRQIHHRPVFSAFVATALGMLVLACSPAAPTAITTAAPASSVVGGRVIDNLQRPVAGAMVEILASVGAGQSVNTDDGGRFTFPVPVTDGIVSLRITKAGYSTSFNTWRPNSAELVVFLRPLSVSTIQGVYQLTFTADPSCGLSPAVQTRTYTANASIPTQGFPSATITLSGATFAPGYSDLTASFGSDAVRFNVFSLYASDVWGDDEPIIERLDSTSYVSFEGVATATVTDANSPVNASFDGTIAYCSAVVDPKVPNFPPTCSVPLAQCKSPQNRLSFVPR